MAFERGAVVRGPHLFADHDHRPYAHLSVDTHPFAEDEALYAAVTTTGRAAAVPLTEDSFRTGGLPRESYANPWTLVSIRHTDVVDVDGWLTEGVTERIALEAAEYLGVSSE